MSPDHYNLNQLFDEVFAAHRQDSALIYADRRVTYDELAKRIEQLAALLLSSGMKRGDVIAIGHTKQELSFALMLAALRIGVAYVNIDVASPTARTARILKTSGACLLFFDDSSSREQMVELAAIAACPLHHLEPDLLLPVSAEDRLLQTCIARQVDGASIAYIMFTSGSTGTPKGVAVTHQNILHFITWGRRRFNISNRDNFANLSPMYFDNSVFDFYVGLFSGAALSPISKRLLTSPYDLANHIGKLGCTVWFSVPSLLIYMMTMKALTTDICPALRTIIFGGEGYPKVELKKLYRLFAQQAQLVNVYGPTECTCICSAHTIEDDDFADLDGLPTLGRLNQNFDYRIADDQDRDATTGELCLIGPNVAAGYFNDLERTAAAFHTITDPSRFMKRMYRTGDIVSERDGRLYFVGRKDNQIKHLGYRIELEEIEHALIRLPGVNQASAVYHRSRAAYGKLVGFVSCDAAPDEKSLLAELAKFLPDYMVPSKLVVLPELPKNPNGKVDRLQLLALLDN